MLLENPQDICQERRINLSRRPLPVEYPATGLSDTDLLLDTPKCTFRASKESQVNNPCACPSLEREEQQASPGRGTRHFQHNMSHCKSHGDLNREPEVGLGDPDGFQQMGSFQTTRSWPTSGVHSFCLSRFCLMFSLQQVSLWNSCLSCSLGHSVMTTPN